MSDAYIVGAVRTPMGRGRAEGSLHNFHPSDLGGFALSEVVKRANVSPEHVEDVIFGCVTPVGEQGLNVARTCVLAAGWPISVPGVQINRMCGSGQQAVTFAASGVSSGTYDLAIGGGVESMSRVSMGSDAGPVAESIQDRFDIINQGLSAELIAEKWGLTRTELDHFALESHRKAHEAREKGYFQKEIVPVKLADGSTMEHDETIRHGTTMEKMASLRTVFKEDGVVTAATSSQISDGASAVLVANEDAVKKHGFTKRARIVKTAVVGTDPTIMLTGPIPATQRVLEKAGMSIDDIDLFEINEAFVPVVLSWQKDLSVPDEKLNVNGGAVALGHPLGATGGRLITTLLHEMERREVRYGLVTMCIGFGQATATIIERLG